MVSYKLDALPDFQRGVTFRRKKDKITSLQENVMTMCAAWFLF
jgi:hypothetical protein